MIVGAWYPVDQYKLSLGVLDRLYDLVILIHEKYNIPCYMNKNKLLAFTRSIYQCIYMKYRCNPSKALYKKFI